MDKLQGFLLDAEDNLMDEESLVDHYVRKEGMTPLDVLVERESRLDIVHILRILKDSLDPIDQEILKLYAIEGKTFRTIAKILNMAPSSIHERWKSIPSKVNKLAEQIPYFDNYMGKDFLIKNSTKEAGSPSGCGFQHEYFEHINIGGRWGKSKGKSIWISQDECRLPEVFQQAFGDDKTVCTKCASCKREV